MKTKEEKAREYLIEKDFTGFANHSSVPSWMVDFADQETAELKEKYEGLDRAANKWRSERDNLLIESKSLRSEIAQLRSRLSDCERKRLTGERI